MMPDPTPRPRTEHELAHRGRGIGESYRDACERLAGQLRATEIDRDRLATEARGLRAELEKARRPQPAGTVLTHAGAHAWDAADAQVGYLTSELRNLLVERNSFKIDDADLALAVENLVGHPSEWPTGASS